MQDFAKLKTYRSEAEIPTSGAFPQQHSQKAQALTVAKFWYKY